MIVKIKPIGLIKAYLKSETNSVHLPEGATVEQLLESITIKEEEMDLSWLKAANFLVNQQQATRQTILHDGDEVIIMLRIAGG